MPDGIEILSGLRAGDVLVAAMRSGASLGLSGRLTQATIRSKLTPLFLLAALAAGLVALFAIPREEEPQISVPMVDILVTADGLRAADAAELVTKPLETIVRAIKDVEHVYSQTQDDRVMVTARFRVGTSQDSAVLRVHDRIRANLDRIPPGIAEPLVVGRGIDDVAIVTLTLSPRPDAAARWSGQDLQHLAMKLQTELAKVEDVGLSTITGAGLDQIRVEPDPEKLSLFGVTLQQLVAKVRDANRSFVAGHVRDAGGLSTVTAGQTLQGVPDIGLLLLATRDGRPVYVRDVARVMVGPGSGEARVWIDRAWSGRAGARAGGNVWRWPSGPAPTRLWCRRPLSTGWRICAGGCCRMTSPCEVTRDYGGRPATRPTSCCSIWDWRRCPSSR